MEIREYTTYNEHEVLSLYSSAGWTNYTEKPEMLKNAFENSLAVLGAFENGKLLGLIRAVGDGHSVVLIQDILVFPEHQRKGIGTSLMKTLLNKFSSVYQIQMFTDNTEKTTAFYKSLGFTEAGALGCTAFMI